MQSSEIMSNLKPINSKNPRLTFSKSSVTHEPLDLLNIQIQSFKEFVQEGVPAHKRKSTGLQKSF